MCDPLSLAAVTTVLSVGGEALGFVGQNQLAAQNKTAANLAYAEDQNAISRRSAELDQTVSENAFDTAVTTAQEQGRISASAADRGLGSSSFISAINASQFGIGRQVSAELLNDQNARTQLASERQASGIRRDNQIRSVPKSNPLSLALGIGKGALAGFNTYSGLGGRI